MKKYETQGSVAFALLPSCMLLAVAPLSSVRAPALGTYWEETCAGTTRPIGGEFIVHAGTVKQTDCLRICKEMGPCHPSTDSTCLDYTQLATLRSAEDAQVAAEEVGRVGIEDQGNSKGALIGWRNDVNAYDTRTRARGL